LDSGLAEPLDVVVEVRLDLVVENIFPHESGTEIRLALEQLGTSLRHRFKAAG